MLWRFLLAILCCRAVVAAYVAVDHQIAWDELLQLDEKLAPEIDGTCENVDMRNEVTRLPSVVFGLQFTQYITLGLKKYPLYPLGGERMAKSHSFDKFKPTVIMVHSELDSKPHLLTGSVMKTALHSNGAFNVLSIDCGRELVPMKTRSLLTRVIGQSLAKDLKMLVDSGYDLQKIHLIGHEIGAHVVGFAGKAFAELTNGTKLPWITALNPSSRCFENVGDNGRLSSQDADYVEVVHTMSGNDLKAPLGHVDFYLIDSIPNSPLFEMWHNMIWRFYAEAIRNRNLFKGIQCESLILFNSGACTYQNRPVAALGLEKANSGGSFFMRLGLRAPYGLGDNGIYPTRPY